MWKILNIKLYIFLAFWKNLKDFSIKWCKIYKTYTTRWIFFYLDGAISAAKFKKTAQLSDKENVRINHHHGRDDVLWTQMMFPLLDSIDHRMEAGWTKPISYQNVCFPTSLRLKKKHLVCLSMMIFFISTQRRNFIGGWKAWLSIESVRF